MQFIDQVKNRPLITFLSIMRISVLSYWTYWIHTYIVPVAMLDEIGYYLLTLTPLLLIAIDLIFSISLYKSVSISWIFLVLLNIGAILYALDWISGSIGAYALFHTSIIIISILQFVVLLQSGIKSE